jgi:GntR family transcriptional regulator
VFEAQPYRSVLERNGVERQLITNLTDRIRGRNASRDVLVKRVADALRDQIRSGELKPGSRLMSEIALAKSLEISRATLREALRILVREGLIDIKHGIGAFVVDERRLIWSRLDSMRSFTELIRSVGGRPGDRDLSVALARAPADVAEALEMPSGTPVGLIKRVRLIDGTPLSIALEYARLDNLQDFQRLKEFSGGSLYEFLRDRCGITLARSSVVIAAIVADAAQAALLKVRKGTPLLQLREPHYDPAGRPVLFAVNYHNSDIVQFTVARAGLPT